MSKKTIGQLSYDLKKNAPYVGNALELSKESEQDYIKSLRECVDTNQQTFPGDFFIEVKTIKEQLMDNVLRNKFIPLNCCPSPEYDQTVFKFDHKKGQIEHIWTLPDRESSHMLVYYRHQVVPAERQILNYVISYASGELFKLMKRLNGEKEETPELIKV